MRWLAPTVLAAAFLAVACGPGDSAAGSTTSGPVTDGPAGNGSGPAGTAKSVGTPSTTAPPGTTAPASSAPAPASTTPGQLPEASQCSPGTDTLPDGLWFGYFGTVLDESLEFDLACWFTGQAAIRAATEDGAESPPPNDYYIRNSSDTLRTIVASANVEVA